MRFKLKDGGIKDEETGRIYGLEETVPLLNKLTEKEVYVYELYTYIFDDFDSGEIYSNKELSKEELMFIIERAIKCVGRNDAECASKVCEKATQLLGCEPVSENIRKKETFRYWFANSNNCGGPEFSFKKKEDGEIYNWFEVIRPKYESRRFFTRAKYHLFIGEDDVNLYTPCKFGLD